MYVSRLLSLSASLRLTLYKAVGENMQSGVCVQKKSAPNSNRKT